MGQPVNFQGVNFTFTAPEGRDDIVDLPCFRNATCTVCCIQLTDEELEDVIKTGKVWLSVMSGSKFYPAFVGSENTVRSVVVDYGNVWVRSSGNSAQQTKD